MPCYEPRDSPSSLRTEFETERKQFRQQFRHSSDVAQLLCEVMRYLEEQLLVRNNQHLSPELKQWWAEHQARDIASKTWP